MNTTPITESRQRTRRLILEAMADVIANQGGIGFSVQAVADRAGVTHRTVYNHFPTRDALCEAFSDYVDELLMEAGGLTSEPDLSLDQLPEQMAGLYRILALRDRHARAYVVLMIGNRRPMQSWRHRTQTIEKMIGRGLAAGIHLKPRQVAAAVRMFVSSMGWHLMTEQCGLSTEEAAAASAWATRTLLDAATATRATPRSSRASSKAKTKTKTATRRRRG